MFTSSLRTERTGVRRQPTRGAYDRDSVYGILDSALFGHVAFVDGGQPFCIPMLQARVDDCIFVHGSSASRTLRVLASGVPACLTVTVLDGLVLARSAFEHSANYRSAVVLGHFVPVEGEAERLAAFAAFTDKLVSGRWDEVRPPNRKERKATAILRMPIDEASAKARSGPPSDDESDDAALDVWAGVLPIVHRFGPPEPSPRLRDGIGLSRSAHRLLAGDAVGAVLERDVGG
ncbi:MAG: pyridoxamine 5'-phosphate oxidase family protein, partial [Actinomycetota bacterium]|nr:pyridoxamine 5'-phosphate oxidase family protein [Actinomycetota bacterium]